MAQAEFLDAKTEKDDNPKKKSVTEENKRLSTTNREVKDQKGGKKESRGEEGEGGHVPGVPRALGQKKRGKTRLARRQGGNYEREGEKHVKEKHSVALYATSQKDQRKKEWKLQAADLKKP